jgi:EmrB/QacA subfamily drug resistance transporter
VPELSHRERTVIIVGLMTGLLLAALDQTIVSTALPTIVGEFGGIDHLSWVVTAYLLGSTASMPLWGKVSDLYGRKRIYQAAIVLFLVASALCGAAQSMGQLIGFRFLQGVGGGGLMSLTFTIVGDIVPPRERGRYTGYLTGTFALASVLGPLVGGFLTDHLSWRWVFYVNLPIGIVALVVTSRVLRIPFHRVPHRLDLVGAGVLVGSVTSLLLATVWASNEYGWGSPTTVGLYLAAAVGGVGFVWWEHRAAEPVLPLRMFTRTGFASCVAVSFVAGAAMFGAIVYLPLFFQGVQGRQATNAGLLLLPLMLALMIGSLVVGRLVTRTGRYKLYPVAGTIVAVVGLWLMSTMEPDTSRLVSSAWMIVLGVGIGATLPVLTVAVQNAVELRDLGAGTASVNFFRTLGSTIGVAVFGAVLTRQLTDAITSGLVGVELPDGATADTLTQDPRALGALTEPLRSIAIGGLSDAITTVFAVAAGVMVIGAIAAITIRELPLRDTATLATAPTPSPEPA